MTQEKVSSLRERMIEDMRIRGMGDKSQKAHIRALKDFAAFFGRSPDTTEPDDLRAYQLHMADTGVAPSTFNARIVALRFFFSTGPVPVSFRSLSSNVCYEGDMEWQRDTQTSFGVMLCGWRRPAT
jgi:hypothetical protein